MPAIVELINSRLGDLWPREADTGRQLKIYGRSAPLPTRGQGLAAAQDIWSPRGLLERSKALGLPTPDDRQFCEYSYFSRLYIGGQDGRTLV